VPTLHKRKQDAAGANFWRAKPGLTNPGFSYKFYLDHLFQASFHKGAVYEEAHYRVDLWVSIGAVIRLGTEMD
jgi:hypothetical protein